MLNAIRNLNFGWIVLLTGLLSMLAGLSMTEGKTGQKTLLCFDAGCVYVQGITNIVVGVLVLGYVGYLLLRKRKQ